MKAKTKTAVDMRKAVLVFLGPDFQENMSTSRWLQSDACKLYSLTGAQTCIAQALSDGGALRSLAGDFDRIFTSSCQSVCVFLSSIFCTCVYGNRIRYLPLQCKDPGRESQQFTRTAKAALFTRIASCCLIFEQAGVMKVITLFGVTSLSAVKQKASGPERPSHRSGRELFRSRGLVPPD